MKATKKIIPALVMLLVSAVLLSTASYAWFSMNTKVTATGMKVKAKSDAIFLEIKGSEDSDYSIEGTNSLDAELYPVAHDDFSALADVTILNNWYYRYNDNAGDADSSMTDKAYISAFTNYVAETSYFVRLHDGSAETGYDLYVSGITIPENTGITVIIAGADGYKEFSETAESIAFNADDVLSETVTGTAQVISVYIYFDGNNSNVYTDNVDALVGEIEFTLSAFTTDQS